MPTGKCKCVASRNTAVTHGLRLARGRRLSVRRLARPHGRRVGRPEQRGVRGIAFSMINNLNELPLFRDEVLPRLERLGVRAVHN